MKKHIIYRVLFSLVFIVLANCESTELNLQENPNVPGPESLDPDTNLNFVLFSFSEFFEEATEAGGESVRLEYMFDTYEVNYQNDNPNLSGMWTLAYADILSEIIAIEPTLLETERYDHLGILKVIRAYTLMTLVDYFGDVPYSGLVAGEEFPGVDPASDLYDQAIEDLNDVEFQFNRERSDSAPGLGSLVNDNFFGGDLAKWQRLANTLKLKYYLNLRLTDEATAKTEITNLLSEDIISNAGDDFTWKAGTSVSPNSRHQYYVEEYDAASTGEYIPNYLAWAMTEEKGIDDPRLRYYIYRQTNAFPTDPATLNNEIDCWNDPRPTTYAPIDAISNVPLPFCSLFDRGDGYWGRDHSENDGIPPDNTKRATFGTYPVGGRFDDDDAEGIGSGDGLVGAGIWPIMMSSFVDFMRAEAAIYLDTGDDARALLESGVRKSVATVMNFLPNPGDFDNIPSASDVDDYVDVVLMAYDDATTDDEQMAVIGKEYWLAMYGNGVEGYNLYRRTGTPINLQPTYLGTGNFPRTFLYPNVSVDRNPNVDQKASTTIKVFWDNNPDGFIQ